MKRIGLVGWMLVAAAARAGQSGEGGAANAAGGVPTFYKEVAPVLQRHCQGCHHQGTVAPMSLTTYDQARPWAKSIRKAVSEGTMPPWHADPAHGKFKNDRRMNEGEVKTIVDWAAGGAPAGDAADQPEPLVFAEGWMIGTPDAVLNLPEHEVPADVEDQFIMFDVPTDFTEDKWVQAVEFRPGNPAVVHHIVTTALGTFAPGRQPSAFEPGMGLLVEAGEKIKVQMHYHKEKGAAAKDASSIGLKFAAGPIHKQVRLEGAFNAGLSIPPGEENYAAKAVYRFRRDSHLIAMKPHMHLRGKDMTYTAVYPDGREEALLAVPRYDYDWQTNYELAEPKAMPKGTVIRVDAHYDNSAKNPHNPDPTRTIRNGELTTDEMMIGWVTYTDDEEDVAAGKVVRQVARWGRGREREE